MNNLTGTAFPHRRIKSFARRSGRMTLGQRKGLETCLPQYLWPDKPEESLQRIEGLNKPLILDIGFGMGHSLVWQAENYPQYHFLGLEVFLPGAARLASLLKEKNIDNADIFLSDVSLFIEDLLPPSCLSGVQLFFPDPWPKKRHQKRRLLQADFLERVQLRMKPGAFLHFASDWMDYSQNVASLLTDSKNFGWQRNSGVEVPARPKTRYEERGLLQGHEIRDIIAFLEKRQDQ